MQRSPLSLKAQALALLARREHSRAELRAKLHAAARRDALRAEAGLSGKTAGDDARDAREASQAEIEVLLDWLESHRHLSEARFVESRVHARAPRQGHARIRQELARHGLALDAETADQLRSTELERARAVWMRKFGSTPADAREQARQMRFMAGRGFAAEVVRRIVGGREDDPGKDQG